MTKILAIERWVKQHPYLKEIAHLETMILAAIEKTDIEEHIEDIPILIKKMDNDTIFLMATTKKDTMIKNSSDILKNMVMMLCGAKLPDKIKEQAKQLKKSLDGDNNHIQRIIHQRITNDHSSKAEEINEGLVTFLAWKALSAYLEPVKEQLRESEDFHWRERYCPICGQSPALSQLVRTNKGRERKLICGCCQMHWKYRRIGCPYCGNDDSNQLCIIEILENENLRIDTCSNCKGYLKTVLDDDEGSLLLADWSTLQLDCIGREHGFKRMGYQMYEV